MPNSEPGQRLAYLYMEEVSLLDGETVIEVISRERARELKAAGKAYFISHGKEMKLLRPIQENKTELEKLSGWNFAHAFSGAVRDCALNRGRCGQFTIGYPIPYAFEGHMKEMRVAIVNAGDQATTRVPVCV